MGLLDTVKQILQASIAFWTWDPTLGGLPTAITEATILPSAREIFSSCDTSMPDWATIVLLRISRNSFSFGEPGLPTSSVKERLK